MHKLSLNFNNHQLSIINMNDGQTWVTSSELARVLGYSRSDKVSRIYDRRKDEFSNSMTQCTKVGVKGFGNGESEKEVRIFNLRGCHLIAMFARTEIAKDFRKWVLDVLDNEIVQAQAARNTLMFRHNEACYQLKIATEIASNAGYNLNKYGKKIKPDLAERVAELENKMQMVLGLE